MSEAGRLLAGILDDPEDELLRLVLADWLEDRGDEPSRVRAELVRLQVERGHLEDAASLRALDERARAICKKHRGLLGPLKPLVRWRGLRPATAILTVRTLPLFLSAPLADAEDGPLVAGSRWEGRLHQDPHAIPTAMRLLKRRHNQVEGDMVEDFTAMHRVAAQGTFLFRGVVVGRERLLFVTYTTHGAGEWPGVYDLRLGRGGWLTGAWSVPGYGMSGQMQLRRQTSA
jgi:uncharacterized protein (TIGR02996 family)